MTSKDETPSLFLPISHYLQPQGAHPTRNAPDNGKPEKEAQPSSNKDSVAEGWTTKDTAQPQTPRSKNSPGDLHPKQEEGKTASYFFSFV